MTSVQVSIIIPVYNGSNYLKEAIDSALAQTYKNFEILVINDGSTDGGKTEKIAKSYGKKIIYIHKKNGGVATALNYGIKHMKGEWFSWLSHDDVYYPDKLSKQINYLNSHPNAKVLYSDFELVDSQLNHLHYINVKSNFITNMQLRLMDSYPLNGCTMLINKQCFVRVGMFDERLPTTQDYDLWFKLAKVYDFDYVPLMAIKSRQHATQGSTSNNHKKEVDQLYARFLNNLYNDPLLIGQINNYQKWLLKLAIVYRERGYIDSPLSIVEHLYQIKGPNILSIITIKIYMILPTSLIIKIADLKHHFMRYLFIFSGYIKRMYMRLRNV